MIATQSQLPVSSVYVLPKAELALYEDMGDCTPGPVALVLKQLENIRVARRLNSVTMKFTGMPYPTPFHMEDVIEITADGIWDVNRLLERNTSYILVLTMRAATLGNGSAAPWCRIYFYVARTNSSDLSSRDGNEMVGSQTISAQYTDNTSGTGVPPAP